MLFDRSGKNDDFNGYIPVVVYNESKMESKQYRTEENLKIGISIFVYDGVPKSRLMQLLYFSHMYILRSKHALCRANFKYVNTTIAKIVGPILQCFFSSKNTKFYKEKILKLQKNTIIRNINMFLQMQIIGLQKKCV